MIICPRCQSCCYPEDFYYFCYRDKSCYLCNDKIYAFSVIENEYKSFRLIVDIGTNKTNIWIKDGPNVENIKYLTSLDLEVSPNITLEELKLLLAFC